MYINLRVVKCITFNQFGYMRKIQLKSSVCINSYMRIDKWGDTYWVDDYTSQQGELIQFYKGGYTLFCLGKNEFRYIN